jgi:hypothetical protein
MSLKELKRTPITRDDFARAIRDADVTISKAAAGVIWGQWCLETGSGKACWNFNIANLKVTGRQVAEGVDYVMLPNTWEIIGGKKVVFQPPHHQTWFRSFESLDEAMVHHLLFLQMRYGSAWECVEAGKPREFAYALKSRGYFTGDVEAYAKGVEWFHRQWMAGVTWDEGEVPEPSEPMGGIIHGTHVVDWALEQREAEFEARLDELVGGFGRYDDVGED